MSDIYSVIALSPLSASSGPAVTLDVLTDQVRAPFLSGLMEAPSLNAVSSHIGWFNVKDDFGAFGDGTTDDTESIQNAIAAAYADIVAGIYRGGVILFPPGAYVVTDTLVVGASGAGGLIFLGAGSQATAYFDAGSCILNKVTSGSLFEINVTGPEGGVVYLSTPGGGTGIETKQNMTFIPLGTDFLVSALSAGAGRPAETTAFMTVTNLTVSGCNLTECSSNGVVVEAALPAVAERLSIIGNSLWGYDGPGTAISLSGTGISNAYVADNPGYNPVGAGSSPPAIAAGATRNPYQQPARVFISATGGAAVPTGITLSPNGVLVELGVGESIDLVGSITGLSWTWFAE